MYTSILYNFLGIYHVTPYIEWGLESGVSDISDKTASSANSHLKDRLIQTLMMTNSACKFQLDNARSG